MLNISIIMIVLKSRTIVFHRDYTLEFPDKL